MVSLPSLK